MNEYDEKLRKFIEENNIDAEHLMFEKSCHSVEEAAESAGASVEDFTKNICMIDEEENPIIGIVKGKDRVSTTKVGEALGIPRPRIANPEEILEKLGFPVGGTPAFAINAKILIDPRVMEKDFVYSGGGSTTSLTKISTKELLKASKGKIVKIRK